MKGRILHIFTVFLWVATCTASAQEAAPWVVPESMPDSIPIQEHLSWKWGPDPVEDGQEPIPFHAVGKEGLALSEIPSGGVLWLKLDVTNPNNVKDTLWLYCGQFDVIRLYEGYNPVAEAGYLSLQTHALAATRQLHVPIPITGLEHTFLLELSNEVRRYEPALRPYLASKSFLLNSISREFYKTRTRNLLGGLVLGGLILLLILSIRLWRTHRLGIYTALPIYLATLLVFQTRIFEAQTGADFLFTAIAPFYHFLETPLFLLCIGAFVWMMIQFFAWKETNPALYKWGVYFLIGILVLGAADLLIKATLGIHLSYSLFTGIRLLLALGAGALALAGLRQQEGIPIRWKQGFAFSLMALVILQGAGLVLFFAGHYVSVPYWNEIALMKLPSAIQSPVFYAQLGILLHAFLLYSAVSGRVGPDTFHSEENSVLESGSDKRIFIKERRNIPPATPVIPTHPSNLGALPRTTKEVHLEAFKLQLKPHFLFNFLNSIIKLVQEGENDLAEEKLASFSQYLRKTLQIFERKRISLKDELALSESYVAAEQLRLKDFKFSVIGAENFDLTDIQVPPLVFQPYLENAILHGLREKKGEKYLTLTFARKQNDLHCFVEDNGIGRKQARLAASRRTGQNNGIGMKITQKRLKEAEIDVKVVDKYRDGIPTGTRIELIIPDQFEP